MAATYNRRCGLCGQFQITEDREALLEDERFEWDESLVDDFIAGSRHLCVDTDPYGAHESARLVEAGELVPELRWLIEAALERRRAAGRPAWAVFTTSAMARSAQPATVGHRPASGAARTAEHTGRSTAPPSNGAGRPPPG